MIRYPKHSKPSHNILTSIILTIEILLDVKRLEVKNIVFDLWVAGKVITHVYIDKKNKKKQERFMTPFKTYKFT